MPPSGRLAQQKNSHSPWRALILYTYEVACKFLYLR